MPIAPTKTVQIKITAPKPIAEQLRAIAEARGMPLSQLLLQAAIDISILRTVMLSNLLMICRDRSPY
ncbi:hypothetical protein H6F67_24720 [Microcoleus sp. FACHB-1515]|uniref:hypothetical protein n=1 Tax=Cyanophyceae TaxID=3028117 RepID=UPI001681F6E1|nr:hypothetical protein [Microcoleus sp. FACHB-1515]MBD2093056.1 hypothetical protein [Microcoleus sp. FACHB-1515]